MALRMTVSGSRLARLRFGEMVLVHFGISRDAVRLMPMAADVVPTLSETLASPFLERVLAVKNKITEPASKV
jgi:hypothetical protein